MQVHHSPSMNYLRNEHGMAEACRLGNRDTEIKTSTNQNENFCVFNVLCVFISLVSILADLTTDIIVFAEYCKDGHLMWALGSFIFIFSPNVLVNVFSMRWFIIDQTSNFRHWLSHGFLIGLLERYVTFLHKVFVCKNWETNETQKLISQRNDLCLLHFLYIFTGTVPQIILQLYAITALDDNYQTKVFALSASIASVFWGYATYVYSNTAFSNENFNWYSFLLKCIWHFSMLISRLQGILLFTVVFDIWILLPLGLHWAAMTIWIITQKTKFCPNKFEEALYNVVMGFVHCFIYINLREGHTRYRLLLFYTLIVTQNFGSLFLYVLETDTEHQKKHWSIATTISLIMGTVLGMAAMILYYRFFHSNGPILWKNIRHDIELNNKNVIQTSNNINNESSLKHVRSFKNSQHTPTTNNNQSKESPLEGTNKRNENTDKKLLLDHWIARSGIPTFTSAPVGNISMNASSIEVYTVENTPQSKEDIRHTNTLIPIPLHPRTGKMKALCAAPSSLSLKLSSLESIESSIDEITSSNLNLNKRRGICPSDELREELNNLNLDISDLLNKDFLKMIRIDHGSEVSQDTDGSNKKTSSDSIDMDLDLSFSDINSSDINTFNENIVQKLCLSALKNIKVGNQDADIENIQRIALDILKEMYAKKDRRKNQSFLSKSRDIDTPTEVLSVHDYENMCAVNIAREAWGLRSWKGYTDIENWVHDGSVVRDRRRDTLTSGSSEVSSCISQELKSAIMTAPPFPKKTHTYSNVFVKFDRTDQDDYANTVICQEDTFLAKPCIADAGKDQNHLEPIMEELDDLGDIDPCCKKRLSSESSLVATIDEIRKCTVTNSPRNLYHRRENTWDSPQFHSIGHRIDPNLKKALWKEPSKCHSSNIMDSFHAKQNVDNINQSKINKTEMKLNIPESSSTIVFGHCDISQNARYDKNTRRRMKRSINNLKHIDSSSDENLQDTTHQNIEQLLWQLVSEDNEFTGLPTSLESFLKKEVPPTLSTSAAKISNIKKNTRSRPRRKFSILRDRFEPKINAHSDEEALFHSTESILNLSPTETNITNVKNHLHRHVPSSTENTTNHLQSCEKTCTTTFSTMTSKNVKDKKSLFVKQVLSPPKFNTKLKYKV